MKFATITFPGSNCDQDVYFVTSNILKQPSAMLWHDEQFDLASYDCVILPGGFSYGDYLRSGAIARFAPIMERVIEYAINGGLVMGICNGFQILLEAGLLPGAMKVNQNLKFVCRYSKLAVVNNQTPFTNCCKDGELLSIPVAHGEGNYYIDRPGLELLQANNQVVLRYRDQQENPNGSVDNIAGICNQAGNVFGMMPHPERCAEAILGNNGTDGLKIFYSLLNYQQKESGAR